MKTFIRITLGFLFTTSTSARAQESDSVRLPDIVVSATKTPSDKSKLGVPVTVISGAELQAKRITRIVDALRETPGISIVQNGSVGSVSSVFLRGGESRYTKILLDGVPVNAPGGYMDLSHLTTDNVERIEIVRGPQSALWGADAIEDASVNSDRGGAGEASVKEGVSAFISGTPDTFKFVRIFPAADPAGHR